MSQPSMVLTITPRRDPIVFTSFAIGIVVDGCNCTRIEILLSAFAMFERAACSVTPDKPELHSSKETGQGLVSGRILFLMVGRRMP